MRIALVSDIHGNLPALEAVVADIGRRGVDQIVNLGDILSGPLLPLETAHYLMAQGWVTVAGNHEHQLLDPEHPARGASDTYADAQLGSAERDWLASLPQTVQLTHEVFLCHGTPAAIRPTSWKPPSRVAYHRLPIERLRLPRHTGG